MKRNDIKKLLEEIDVLLFLASKGEEERKLFAWQTFVWGTYVLFNMTLWLLLPQITKAVPGSPWFHTLFIAFYFSTVPFVGWTRSLVWVAAYVLSAVAFYLLPPALFIATTVAGITLASFLVYGLLSNRRANRRISITAYIGIVWGLLFASFWWTFALHKNAFSDEVFNLWITYVFGAGILLSGVVFRRFFLLGLFILFALPVFSYFGKQYLLWGYDLAALIMSLMGITLYLKR